MKVPLDIQLVNQDDMKSCSLACIAMLTGRSLLEIRVTAKEIGIEAPCTSLQVARLLTVFGLYALPQNGMSEKTFTWDSIFIVTAPTLNTAGNNTCHHVIADLRGRSEIVYDPQKDRPGLEFYEWSNLQCFDSMEIINV